MTTDVFERYAALDPAESAPVLPDWTDDLTTIDIAAERLTRTIRLVPVPARHRPGVPVAVAVLIAVVVVGFGLLLLIRTNETQPAEPITTAPTTVAPVVDGLDAVGPEIALSLTDLAVGPDGQMNVAGPAGIAARTPEEGWRNLDVDGLPAGTGSPWPPEWPNTWPGRDIQFVEVGPDGEVLAAGVSFSHVDDVEFGGEYNPFFDARFLNWVAVGRCDVASCQWDVFDSDDLPGLGVTAAAIGPDGTAYVANEGGSVLVHDDSGWASRAAPSGDIESLAVTVDGMVWAGTTSGGRLYSFDGADFTEYDLDNVFPGAGEVTVSSARDDGIVWVSVDAADGAGLGVGSFDGERWTIHDEAHGMWSDHAQLAVGSNGVVWATHDEAGHGYSRYDGGGWTGFASSQPVGGGGEVAPDGTLWTTVADPDHTSSVVESWLVSFDGISETIHDAPFTGLPQSGTITISIEGATDLDGHRLLIGAWNGNDLVGGAFWTRVDSDPFSARDALHPPAWGDQAAPTDADGWGADDYLWDRTATLRPGKYRIVAWAHPGELNPFGSHIPAGPIERSCILGVVVNAGETTLVTISDIPTAHRDEPCPSVPSGNLSVVVSDLEGHDGEQLAGVLLTGPPPGEGLAGFVTKVDSDPFSAVIKLGQVDQEWGEDPARWPWPSGVASVPPGDYTLRIALGEGYCCYNRWLPADTRGLQLCDVEVTIARGSQEIEITDIPQPGQGSSCSTS